MLVSFADFLIELGVPSAGFRSLDDLFEQFPQITEGVSTITVQTPEGQKTIRPAYERAHRYFIWEHKRLDYPRSQPYATGKWADYRHWLDAMVTFSLVDLQRIADEARAFVLEQLTPHVFNPLDVRVEPPIFLMLLRDFPFAQRAVRETTGASFQAAVFAYIRADAPHLQVEARKVRTGSAREAGIGDIDAWEGDQLVISAEVKHYVVTGAIQEEIEFFVSEVRQRGALGLVIAEDFRDGARETIEALGITPLSRADLVRIVALWDPLKQRAALNAFQWVVVHREQNGPLIERVARFLADVGYRATNLAPNQPT
ncbi:MAG: hypothetical protein H3C38_05605 [Rhodospirillales bacterium]|nr:hypothetical protein [Rhodospirillales bacterium]